MKSSGEIDQFTFFQDNRNLIFIRILKYLLKNTNKKMIKY